MTGSHIRANKRLMILAFFSTILLFSTASISQIRSQPQVSVAHNIGANTQNDLTAADARSPYSPNTALPTLSAQRAPAPREEKVLVLRGKLLDKSFDVNVNAMRTLFNVTVKGYYDQVSYDQVFLNVTYLPYNYTLPQTEAYYGEYSVSGGREIDLHVEDLVFDTLTAAKNNVTVLGGYSIFEHIIVVHSGTDEAATRQPNDITSQFIYRDHSTLLTIGGVNIMNACIVSENDPLGVVVHELGHSMGLPDLYSYQASDSSSSDIFVGAWDLMATGSWNPNGQGTSPSHLTTWCKIQLHWIKPTQIVNISQSDIQSGHNVTVFLDPQELSGQNLAIKILLNNGTYYLIEDRQKLGYDGSIPGSGVLILFCANKTSGDGPARVVSAHPPSLGSDAPFNLGWFAQDFYGNSALNLGVKVLNKWDNGTFKVIVGAYAAVYNTPTEYKDISIPVIAGVAIIALISVVAVLVYIRRGRQKTHADYQGATVIKIS
jgi:M6 family metalloprotease-like protein